MTKIIETTTSWGSAYQGINSMNAMNVELPTALDIKNKIIKSIILNKEINIADISNNPFQIRPDDGEIVEVTVVAVKNKQFYINEVIVTYKGAENDVKTVKNVVETANQEVIKEGREGNSDFYLIHKIKDFKDVVKEVGGKKVAEKEKAKIAQRKADRVSIAAFGGLGASAIFLIAAIVISILFATNVLNPAIAIPLIAGLGGAGGAFGLTSMGAILVNKVQYGSDIDDFNSRYKENPDLKIQKGSESFSFVSKVDLLEQQKHVENLKKQRSQEKNIEKYS
jgi:hypothetical protein